MLGGNPRINRNPCDSFLQCIVIQAVKLGSYENFIAFAQNAQFMAIARAVSG